MKIILELPFLVKIILELHNKIVSQPEVASGMDQYISKQVVKENYIQVNLDEALCKKFQLHFVGYNFVVFFTSLSTKVSEQLENAQSFKHPLPASEVHQEVQEDIRWSPSLDEDPFLHLRRRY